MYDRDIMTARHEKVDARTREVLVREESHY